MSEVSKLFDALSSDTSKKHVDLKFFLGDESVCVDVIARECRRAIEQDQAGALKVW